MERRTCFDCEYCVWDRGLWLRSLPSGFPARPMCANHPDTPGKLREAPTDGPCRNFRRRRGPPSNGPWVPPVEVRPLTQEDRTEVRYIPLTQGLFATVDAADYEELSKYRWHATKVGNNVYATRDEEGHTIYMHRQLMHPPKGMVVHHIDHNGVNNRRSNNLRVCTPEENWANRKPRGGSSKFIGVHRHKDKWQAGITYRNEFFYLGLFTDEAEAARARDRKAVELHGRLALLNFPEEWTLGADGIPRPVGAEPDCCPRLLQGDSENLVSSDQGHGLVTRMSSR